MEQISKEDIEKIDSFAKFCKEKCLKVLFRSDGTYKVEHDYYGKENR